jgi:alkanesulfonate monooxygenase SsuD/methylene tetrahydromethanopterin reductase-like flavin-dependent oxidoreductase (luciferase family)
MAAQYADHLNIICDRADIGRKVAALADRIPPDRRSRVFLGTPEQIAEAVQHDVLDAGVGGLTINLILNGHEPGRVELAGRTLGPLLG